MKNRSKDTFASYTLAPGANTTDRAEFIAFGPMSPDDSPSGIENTPALTFRAGTMFNHFFSIARRANPIFALNTHFNFFQVFDGGFSKYISRDIEPTAQWGDEIFQAAKEAISRYKNPSARLNDITARALTGTGSETFIVGLTLAGGDSFQRVVAKQIGPTLVNFGFASGDVATDPFLELYKGAGFLGSNDSYGTSSDSAGNLNALKLIKNSLYYINGLNFGYSMSSEEAAITADLPQGAYTYAVKDNSSGSRISHLRLVAMDEIGANEIIESSVLARTETGGRIIIIGFSLSSSATVAILGAGPSLSGIVSGYVVDPVLELFDGSGTSIEVSADVGTAPSVQPYFSWPLNPQDGAIVRTLGAGSYSVHLRNESPGTSADGVGLLSVRKL